MAVGTPGGKGLDLEEALKAYFWRAGYFVVRGVPFRLDDEDVTDIDLWVYERPAALTRRRLIVDAKNRRSPKVSERIIWASGLRAALGVDGAIVATTDRRPAARTWPKRSISCCWAATRSPNSPIASSSTKQANYGPRCSIRPSSGSMTADVPPNGVRICVTPGALISGMGVQSANRNLAASGFFAEQAVAAQPHSEPAQIAFASSI